MRACHFSDLAVNELLGLGEREWLRFAHTWRGGFQLFFTEYHPALPETVPIKAVGMVKPCKGDRKMGIISKDGDIFFTAS